MMRDVIATKEGPQAIGPYSQAIRANGFIFVSGQVAIDPANQQFIAGDVAAQTDRAMRNLAGILKAAGSSLEKVVRATVFLKNMNDFAAMNEVYGKYFSSAPPARSTVEVARLPKDAVVQFDCLPEQAFFAQRRIWASRAKRRVLCDAIIARLAHLLTKLHHYRNS